MSTIVKLIVLNIIKSGKVKQSYAEIYNIWRMNIIKNMENASNLDKAVKSLMSLYTSGGKEICTASHCGKWVTFPPSLKSRADICSDNSTSGHLHERTEHRICFFPNHVHHNIIYNSRKKIKNGSKVFLRFREENQMYILPMDYYGVLKKNKILIMCCNIDKSKNILPVQTIFSQLGKIEHENNIIWPTECGV